MDDIDYSEQISRIKLKLSKARKIDRGLKVFGASHHQYKTGTGIPKQELAEFKNTYNISLPPDFEAFMLAFGQSKDFAKKSIAGPFYGIFKLGFDRAIIPDGSLEFLSKNPVLNPHMSKAEWQNLLDGMPEEDKAYDDYERRLMSGVYTLGEQGCSSYHALLLTGEYSGKVVNLDIEFYAENPPKFAFERNFLDWYERWLDEVISGVLVRNEGYWFGYVMRGNEEHLLDIASKSQAEQSKLDALDGFSIINSVNQSTLQGLCHLVENEEGEVKYLSLKTLTKFNSELARPYLKEMIKGDDTDCKAACESVFIYAKFDAKLFSDEVLNRLPSIDDKDAYRFAMYILDEIDGDFSGIIAKGLTHSNIDIRVSSVFHLGKQKFNSGLVPYFVAGLQDDEHQVVHASLQALKGSKDIRFLEPYYYIANSYAWDDTYVLVNLEHRLNEIGFRSVTYFKDCYESGIASNIFEKYTFGKGVLNYLGRAFGK